MKDQYQARGQGVRWAGPISFLFGGLILFFLPLLAGWEKFFYDDIAFVFYPQQVFLARCLGEGVIPWWNPHLCAGATPFYAHIFQSSLAPLNWPFLLLGYLDPVRDYLWLIKLPLTVYYLLAAVLAYVFSRRGLRLNPAGSLIFSLAYSLGPALVYLSTCPPEVQILAWLPLFCLCLIEFSRRGGWAWLLLGGGAFAFASPAGDVPVVSHVIFISALFGTGLVIASLAGRDWRRAARVIAAGFFIFGVGTLLAGVYWSNMFDGLRMLGEDMGGVVEGLSGREQSLSPLYLITLLVPDYFGGVTSHHAWGAAYQIELSLNDANLLGGLAAVFLVAAGFFIVIRKTGRGDEGVYSPRRLWWVFAGILVFGVLVVLGGYTPAHGLFRRIIPVLKMPYPVRFRSIECFALAGLLGISAHLLMASRLKRPGRIFTGYAIFVLAVSLLAFFWPYSDRGNLFSPGFRHLSHLGDWEWFIRGPLAYLLAGGLIIAGLTFFRRGRYLGMGLTVVVAAEIVLFAYPAFYHNKILNRRNWDVYAERYPGPESHPQYRRILSWRPEGDSEAGRYRRLYYRSYYDNLVWLDGALSILGFDIKPLDGRFQSAIEELTEGFPYEVKVLRWDSRFWPNMSVRYLLADQALRRRDLRPEGRVGELYAYRDRSALPRFFLQDRVVSCTEAEAREELLEGDLRRGAFVEGSDQLSVVSNQWAGEGGATDYRSLITDYRSFDPDPDSTYLSHFYRLQSAHPITVSETGNPNRLELEIEVSRPMMLVVTDLWHSGWRAKMDGVTVPIYRVNYLQRGIRCPPGLHRISMEFRPPGLRRGLLLTGIGAVFFSVFIGLAFFPRPQKILEGDNGE